MSLLSCLRRLPIAVICVNCLIFVPVEGMAGGPKYVAGVSYFNPAVAGQPVHWAGGLVNYYVDQGPLNSAISNQQAVAMVDAAAALWSAVPTAAVTLVDQGPLNEDVSGANIGSVGGLITQPSDVTSSATNFPLAIIFDADGSVIDAVFGDGASDPTSCQNNGVFTWIDSINPDATTAHAVILLNGLCAANDNLLTMMSFKLERAFGRVLGLDYSQVNEGALQNGEIGGSLGWPVMQPESGVCGAGGGVCIPRPAVLRVDDIAALNRVYPITVENMGNFPGKVLTAANTVSIQGTIRFRTGLGMQGVNVVLRPLDANGNPLYQYTATAVTGAYFNGDHGNPITGWTDEAEDSLDEYGSEDPALEGFFDLSGVPLPPGLATANYMVTFEPVNPVYMRMSAVGPYLAGSPNPSGTMPAVSVPGMSAGAAQTVNMTIADSAAGGANDAIGTEGAPRMLPASGMWCGRLSQVGQTDWFTFPVRGGRTFTVVTQAVNEAGAPSNVKAQPALGIWDAFDPVGTIPVGAAGGLNGWAAGETWLRVSSSGDDIVRIGIADQRGDGRPDYAYDGWVLYADTVSPVRLPAAGGPIVIHGMGFHLEDTVLVGGQAALVTSVTPNEITAIAPPAPAGFAGSVDVEVDGDPIFYAAALIAGGLSYDAGDADALNLVTAPMNTVPVGVPIPFAVAALGPDLKPAGGVTVNYTLIAGNAILACGQPTCVLTASGDGQASLNVTAVDGTFSIVTASLTNGSNLQAQFNGGTPPVLAAMTPTLHVAAGAVATWTVQAIVLSNGNPISGQAVSWQSSTGITSLASYPAMTDPSGVATRSLTVGPLQKGQSVTTSACLNGTSQCVSFTAFGSRPEIASIEPVSGTLQSHPVSGTADQINLRLLDGNGNPMAGGTVNLYQALYAWSPPCGRHGRCAEGELLATQTATAISSLDGSVTFTPASMPGVATNVKGIAVTGNSSSLNISIEQHP